MLECAGVELRSPWCIARGCPSQYTLDNKNKLLASCIIAATVVLSFHQKAASFHQKATSFHKKAASFHCACCALYLALLNSHTHKHTHIIDRLLDSKQQLKRINRQTDKQTFLVFFLRLVEEGRGKKKKERKKLCPLRTKCKTSPQKLGFVNFRFFPTTSHIGYPSFRLTLAWPKNKCMYVIDQSKWLWLLIS